MKKLITIVFIVFIMLSASITVCAVEEDDYYETYMQSSGADELISSLSSEVKDSLDDFGISEISFDLIYNISFKSVLKNIFSIFFERIENPLKSIAVIIGVIMLLTLAKAFQPAEKKMESAIDFTAILLCALAVIVPITQSLSNVLSAIKLSGDFMLVFIPVFVALISASGNPITALSYNTLVLGVSEVVSQLSSKFLSPFISMLISLNIVSAVTATVHIEKISQFVKNAVTVSLSFLATLFVAFLTTKSLLGNAADTVAAKGIKFLAGSLIPVVGGAISDAYGSIVGAIGMIKGAVGVFGIITVMIINLPIICEVIIWISTLYIGEFVSNLFGQKSISVLLKGTSQAMQLTLAILLFNLFIMTISTGVILAVKADL